MSGEPRILKTDIMSYDVPEKSLHEFILDNARPHKDKTFTIDYETGKTKTYGNFIDDVLRLGKALKVTGLCPGDIFLIYGYNSYEYYVNYVGGLCAGGIAIAVRGQDVAFEVCHEIQTRGVKWVFVQAELADAVKVIREKHPQVKIFCFDEENDPNNNIVNLDKDIVTVRTMINSNSPLQPDEIYKPDNVRTTPFAILESSGTTGPAKGSFLPHYAFVALYTAPSLFGKTRETDVQLLCSPMAHLTGSSLLIMPTILGNPVVVMREADKDKLADAIQKYKITSLMLSPSTLNVFANWDREVDFSSIRQVIISGAKAIPSAVEGFIKRYKPERLINGYGMTETGGLITEGDLCTIDGKTVSYDTVGKCRPLNEIKFVDLTTGELLGPNQNGEVHVRTPLRFLGYHNDPEKTKATIDEEGWIHTGDIGYFDENEYIYIVDRIKDMIDQNGFHFAPGDIEEPLNTHKDVVDVCAVGIPQKGGGDLAHAFVILKEGSKVTEEELKNYVNEKVSKLKQIQGGVHFVSEFPKTGFGKVKRNQLRDEYLKAQGN